MRGSVGISAQRAVGRAVDGVRWPMGAAGGIWWVAPCGQDIQAVIRVSSTGSSNTGESGSMRGML